MHVIACGRYNTELNLLCEVPKATKIKKYMFDRTLAVAPMLDWTDRHCRYFHRLLANKAVLYTEMVTTGAILYGPRATLLAYNPSEHPVALQLGGSDPQALASCAVLGEEAGFDEINLNIGCPSNRVQAGRFGACLMAEPDLVAEGVAAMRTKVKIPVTVKSRIGIDEQDSYAALAHFISTIAKAGCQTFIIHARKAWLSGLSPKENREIPPLRYDVVEQIKRDFPNLQIILNGGITVVEHALEHLSTLDGIMLGRAAYHNPYILAEIDHRLYQKATQPICRQEVLNRYLPYVEQQLSSGTNLATLIRPILGLFQGQPGARAWRRYLSEHSHKHGANISVITEALKGNN